MKTLLLFTGVLIMTQAVYALDSVEPLLTHSSQSTYFDLSHYQKNLENKPHLSLPLEEEITLLKQLSEFELGRFLLENKGLNGYWTAYLILHGPQKNHLSSLEQWIVHSAPTVQATQERFKIFKEILQRQVRNDIKMASVPCGLMDDLLGLDYTGFTGIQLAGIDLDEQSLQLAKENAKAYGIDQVKLIKKDAWALEDPEAYDVITSNGLNIYQPDDEKVIALYKTFYQALKPNGVLVTSFLTPAPALSFESTWKNVNSADLLKQKALFSDIIQVNWQSFRTEAQTRMQLAKAGFKVVEVIYDSRGMFPTVIAQK